MITLTRGNLLESDADALVNTVNTFGSMGKGLALTFKETFPGNYRLYRAACERREVQVGRMFVTSLRSEPCPRWIINFPTKENPRQPSKLEWIIEGLKDLRRVVLENRIASVAIPPLGCGLGGLQWSDVRPLIEATFDDLHTVDVSLYAPTTTP